MTNYRVSVPFGVHRETIQLPASKSISNRALILNALSYSPFEITNLSDCDDTEVMVAVLHSNSNHFDVKAAGTAMRFLTAFLSKIVGEWTITGTERMRNRPIKELVDALTSLGARIDYVEKAGYPPLRIFGSALQGGELSINGSVSSQYISALLMVAPLMKKGLTLHLMGEVISRPYIHITLSLMKQFGVTAVWEGDTIRVAPQEYTPVPFTVESDWSAASYWYAISCLSGCSMELAGLGEDSLQGDAAGAALFRQLGVETEFTDGGVRLIPNGSRCKELVYDFVNEPDLAQTFAVTSVLLNIPFRFSGLQSLKIKETDRSAALLAELKKLGYVVRETTGNGLQWDGERCAAEHDPVIETYEDHRMAMAFAPAALVLPEGIRIAAPGVVSKSYPRFWDDLRKVGFILN